jgi:hypothetical protein
MSFDIRLEKAYERVQLVSGMGHPRRGMLCVMSMVAFLSGDRHTDEPRCASSVIRLFAIPINDGMDDESRQRLKPFAPRIIGTNDGRDQERAKILRDAMLAEVLPEALKDWTPHFRQDDGRWTSEIPGELMDAIADGKKNKVRWLLKSLQAQGAGLLETMTLIAHAYRKGMNISVAGAAGSLMVSLALAASETERSTWYWNKAVDLLDRMCDVGADTRRPRIRKDRLQAMAAMAAEPDDKTTGQAVCFAQATA